MSPENLENEIGETEAVRNSIRNQEEKFVSGLESMVDEGMKDHPPLADFVKSKMFAALTTSEKALVADSSLAVYKAVVENPPDKAKDVELQYPEKVSLTGLIMVIEDEIVPETANDKNKIFELIRADMSNNSELAEYIVMRTKETVDLDGARLVGETALTVYSTLGTYLSITK